MNRERWIAPLKCLALISFLLLSACTNIPTDADVAGDKPSLQQIQRAAGSIRKLIGDAQSDSGQIKNDREAREHYDRALSTWRDAASRINTYGNLGFTSGIVKVFDAYSTYLIETKKPSLAAKVLRDAIQESDQLGSYLWAEVFRIQLADTLASIGQVDAAQSALNEAQAISERIYGKLTFNSVKVDLFHLAEYATILSARIRTGAAVDESELQRFSDLYEKTATANPHLRFITLLSSGNEFAEWAPTLKDSAHYRHDQEYWRWIAVGALRAGNVRLAKTAVDRMLRSAEIAGDNRFSNKDAWLYESGRHTSYMINYYFTSDKLRQEKSSDTVFGLETKFESLLAGAEIYLQLNDPARAEKLIAQVKILLPEIDKFSTALLRQGHLGLKVAQRTGELQRITAKLHIKNKRWREALLELEHYISWSETYRNSLSLEERLPYFRGQSQGAYLDALLARAALFSAEPTASNFNLALDALENMKARHLKDALDSAGQTKDPANLSNRNKLDAILKEGKAFLSIADTGDHLIVFYADQKVNQIRLVKKPTEFNQNVLSLRNGLAERQFFDAASARKISVLALGELEDRVFEKNKLIAEIDGVLSFLPVELWLNAKMQPLGRATAVSYIPALAMTLRNRPANTAKGILAVGDARFDQTQQLNAIGAMNEISLRGKRAVAGFAPLPETRDEINSILKNVREGGKAMLGQNATKSEFIRESQTAYRYLHFATHGVVGGEIPRLNEPALVLTPENNDPGFLTASEIGRMKISADLVVLSACNTGNGEYFNGEGLMGLGRAFIVAGAKAVVVSLWPVDSNTTKDLMVRFYQELESSGDTTLALAAARKAVMEGGGVGGRAGDQRGLKRKPGQSVGGDFNGSKNPFFWAPFVLIDVGSQS